MMVGRVPIYLLDTNLELNHPDDRALMNKLYAGGPDMRLRQEWILGVGGVRVLRALGINPAVWHANEGHAAFMMVERLREHAIAGVPYDEAVRRVRASGVFTTHTPVPAGHDTFPVDQVEQCGGRMWEEMKIDRDAYFNIGRHPDGYPGQFHMTVAAMRLSARVNWYTLWSTSLPGLSAGWALPAKMICTGRQGSTRSRRSRSRSRKIRLARL
jgi:starch phosphorylase